MTFGSFGVKMLRQVYLGLMLLLEVLLLLAALAFLGRGLLRIRSRRPGGRAVGGTGSSRLYRTCQNDEVDKHCAQFFVNSSLSPVLLFRRRLKSVADVLKGIRSKRVYSVSLGCFSEVLGCCMSSWSVWVPFLLFIFGIVGFLLICIVFIKWVFDSLEGVEWFPSAGCYLS